MHSRNLTAIVTLALLVGCMIGCSNPYTPAGHEGYVFERPRVFGKGGFRGVINGPGNYGVSAFRNQVVNIDLRPQTYSETFKILAKDDLNVAFQVHAVLSIQGGGTEEVVLERGGIEWYQRFVREPFRTFVRGQVQSFNSREIKSRRVEIADSVRELLTGYLSETPFQVVNLVVGNIDYPEIVTQAVEKKLAAKQLLEEKETQKEIAQRDAEIRVEEAKGIAAAQEIINTTLTPYYLQHEAVQAQLKMAESPNHTTVYIPVGSNGIPLVYTAK